MCALCAAIASSRAARLRKLGVGAALTIVIGGGGAFLLTRPTTPPPAAKLDAGDPVEGFERERLAKEPCEPKTSLALVELLMDAARWQDAKTFASGSIAKCGVIGRMKWYLAHIDQQLHDYPDTERVTGELIAAEPDDSDFWWWRGEALTYDGKPDAALADDRQSLALSDGAQAAQFAAQRIATPAKDAHAMCEADRAWRYYVRTLGGEVTQDMRDETAAHVREKTCSAELGTGHTVLRGRAKVTLTTAAGDGFATLEVDPRLGSTLISRELAARAGMIVPDEPIAHATSRGRIYAGVAMRVMLKVEGASARGVDVLITDDLPGDAGGILGLSFLWHFELERLSAESIVISPLDATAL